MTKREKILDNVCDSLEIEIMRIQSYLEEEDHKLAQMVLISSRLERKKAIETGPTDEEILMVQMAISVERELPDSNTKRLMKSLISKVREAWTWK